MHERRTGALILGVVGIAAFLVLAAGLYASGILVDANQLNPDGAFVGPMVLAVIAAVVGLGSLIAWFAFPRKDAQQKH